jgi:putative nucleotidyltransferase with HDIG domain
MRPETLKNCAFYDAILKRGGELHLVGGSVRDALLGKECKDLDLVVRRIGIDELTALLKSCGRTNLVGKSFGIIKFNPKESPETELDIALPRSESSTGTGHRDFKVDFDPNLELATDLARRDFTVNAMAVNLATGEKTDPFRGREDLDAKTIRAVFDNSFREDPLRLIRAVQFAARLEFSIEPATLAQMKEQSKLIRTVAKERVAEEIRKLFTAPKPSVGFDIMRDTGLLEIIFPDVQRMIGVTQPNKNNEDVYSHTMKVLDAARQADELEKPGDPEIMFAALFHDAGKPKTRRESEDEAKRVTFFNHQLISTGIAWHWMKEYRVTTVGVNPKHVCHLVKNHMFETKEFGNERALRRFITKVGPENVFDLLDLRLADKKGGRFPKKVFGILQLREKIRAEIDKKPPFTAKDLALDGHAIMAMGFKPGPIIGRIQKFLMELVIDDPGLNVKETLAKMVEEKRSELEGQTRSG